MSRFDGLNPRSIELFGRPVWELSREELTRLYQERGIMPPAPPKLSIVRDTPTDDAPPA